MVKKITTEDKTLYQCEECGFYYETEERAKECQAWCGEHNSCNIIITKDAVELPESE